MADKESGKKQGYKLLSQNKKAYHDYYIEDTCEAGVSLAGTEVKSLREGRCNLRDSYVEFKDGEAFVVNMHISPYEQGNQFNKDPLRKRRLLLHKSEIRKLHGAVSKEGLTVVPTKAYLRGSLVKIEIAVAKGKKLYDKRDSLMKKEHDREIQKAFKERNR